MLLSLKQAAKATGKSKPTILRAVESHQISATRDEAGEEWRIEASELYRVFPPDLQKPVLLGEKKRGAAMGKAALRREIEIREQQLEALRAERGREREDKDRQIASLTGQLMAANEERRMMLPQLTTLLTDQRAPAGLYPNGQADLSGGIPMAVASAPTQAPGPTKEKGWFRRMIGGR